MVFNLILLMFKGDSVFGSVISSGNKVCTYLWFSELTVDFVSFFEGGQSKSSSPFSFPIP